MKKLVFFVLPFLFLVSTAQAEELETNKEKNKEKWTKEIFKLSPDQKLDLILFQDGKKFINFQLGLEKSNEDFRSEENNLEDIAVTYHVAYEINF